MVDISSSRTGNTFSIPFSSTICENSELLYGIQYVEQEESYTSKSSYLDKDVLPVYKAEQPYTGAFSGKRIYRGLYKAADGTTINADVNGAANILRKVSGYSCKSRPS